MLIPRIDGKVSTNSCAECSHCKSLVLLLKNFILFLTVSGAKLSVPENLLITLVASKPSVDRLSIFALTDSGAKPIALGLVLITFAASKPSAVRLSNFSLTVSGARPSAPG